MKKFLYLVFSTFFLLIYQHSSAQISGDTSVCKNEQSTYNVSPSSGVSFSWSISGNGSIISSNTNDTIVVQFGNSGTATLSVTVIDANGNVSLYSMLIYVRPKPLPKITFAQYPGCAQPIDTNQGSAGVQGENRIECYKVCKNSVQGFSTQLNPGSTYLWIVSGANSFTGQFTDSITVWWDNSFTGSITVIETNVWGCVDSHKICIEKLDLPIANAQCNSNVCLNQLTQFINLSIGANSYLWDFGDGNTSTQLNPWHSYSSPGGYTVTLIAITNCNCRDTFSCTVNVDSLPGPEIDCPATVCAGDNATYSTNAVGCTYQWGAVGGTIIGSSTSSSVTIAWGPGMIGQVWLVVSGCTGLCSDTTFVSIPIVPSIATISGPNKVCDGECAEYSLPPFGGATYTWTLNGFGTIVSGQGCHDIKICRPKLWTAYNDTLNVMYYDSFLNCGGSAQLIIRVRPELTINGPLKVCANSSSSYSSNPFVPCNWFIVPGGPIIAGNLSPSVTINWNNLPGNYSLYAVALNPNATCNDTTWINIEVVAPPPALSFTGDTIICPGIAYSYCTSSNLNVTWLVTGGTPGSGNGNCISVVWNNIGPYQISVFQQMLNSPFCNSDTTVQNITSLLPLPPPNIIGANIDCANDTMSLSNSIIYPAGVTYQWSVSPANAGTIISGQGTNNVIFEWGNNAPSSVTVTLTVNACNQQISSTKVINLLPVPSVNITQIGNLCAGGTAQLQASAGFLTYNWSGPAFIGSGNPVVISNTGVYQLSATNSNGCVAKKSITVNQAPGPLASISTADPIVYCIGTPFVATLNALTNPNYSYNWSPPGSITSSLSVSTPGTYNVTITDVTTGCTAVSNPITISVTTCNGQGSCTPNAAFFVDFTHSGCNPKSFTNTSVGASTFTWNFGDGFTSNAISPTHLYNNAGFYLVTLQGYVPDITGLDSCLISDTAKIKIPLSPRFSFTQNCGTACFTDLSSFTFGNNITGWNWNFGDLSTSTLQNPCHTYASGGIYTVTLTITDGTCVATFTQTINIIGGPNANFSFPNPNCVNSPVLFNNLSTPAATINYWNWNFGDAGTSLNQNPNHSYANAGNYTITFWVQDIYGCVDSLLDTITIIAPIAGGPITALPDTVVCSGEIVTLIAPPCAGCTYLWNNTSTNDSIWVTASGIYSVTVTDINGCAFDTSINIVVNPLPPMSIWNTGSDEFCFNNGFAFINVTQNTNYTYQWISNDPSANGQTLSSVFVPGVTPVGSYFYQVVITDTSTGCGDTTLPYWIVINPNPIPPTITVIGSNSVCDGDTIKMFVTHPDPAVIFKWSTGEITDTICVTEDGCYSVQAIDTNGCKSTAFQCVTIWENPCIEQFWTGCLDTCNPFTLWAPSGYASYQWLKNDTILSGETNLSYTATTNGCYSVILTTINGCVDTTGCVDLNLYPCDSFCANLHLDSLYCNDNGDYILIYSIYNNTPYNIDEVNLLVLPPHLNLLYAPVTNYINIPPYTNSPPLNITIANANVGDTLCFTAMIHAHDSSDVELMCCKSDTVCIIVPDCNEDSTCCFAQFTDDSVWCEVGPVGPVHGFSLDVNGCGLMQIQFGPGVTINGPNPLTLAGPTTISGTFLSGGVDTIVCLTFVVSDSTKYCLDTTICLHLPDCSDPQNPCVMEYNRRICVGQSATFTYPTPQLGTTYQWQFQNGSPATASGPGPHNVTYTTAGCHQVILIITQGNQTWDCVDSICVFAIPVASVSQSGNSLQALPGGMNYQWYSMPGMVLIPGEINQFFNPTNSGLYCVIVSNPAGCKDTACIDFMLVDLQETETNWRLYPNPVENVLHIETDISQIVLLQIQDVTGRLVYEKNVEGGHVAIHFNNQISQGIYQVSLMAENKRKISRIMFK